VCVCVCVCVKYKSTGNNACFICFEDANRNLMQMFFLLEDMYLNYKINLFNNRKTSLVERGS
jgi:hypothetical protein